MKLRAIALSLLIVIAASLPVSASVFYSSGQYRFDCDVRNDAFRDIRDVRVSGFASGSSARLQFDAPGYQTGYEYVYLQPNTNDYRVNARLRDASVFFDAFNNRGERIAGASVNNYQGMYWGDEYGAVFTVPKAGFVNLTQQGVEARVNHFTPFGARVYLTGGKDAWRIEVVVKRRDMNQFSNNMAIYLKADEAAANIAAVRKPETLDAKIRMLAELTTKRFDMPAETLAGQAGVLRADIAEEAVRSMCPGDLILRLEAMGGALYDTAQDIKKRLAAERLMK